MEVCGYRLQGYRVTSCYTLRVSGCFIPIAIGIALQACPTDLCGLVFKIIFAGQAGFRLQGYMLRVSDCFTLRVSCCALHVSGYRVTSCYKLFHSFCRCPFRDKIWVEIIE